MPLSDQPTVYIDLDSATPPYDQLRAQIEQLIRNGHLSDGQSLPPIRDLAADLRLAPGTVARAYKELAAHGLVHMAGRRGTVVTYSPKETPHLPPDVASAADALFVAAKANHTPREAVSTYLDRLFQNL